MQVTLSVDSISRRDRVSGSNQKEDQACGSNILAYRLIKTNDQQKTDTYYRAALSIILNENANGRDTCQ